MNIVECIPLKRNLQKETLSYFTNKEVALGSIVTIPLRNQNIPALVLEKRSISDERLLVKGASFALRKVLGVRSEGIFFPETIAAATYCAQYYIGNTGSILAQFTPQAVLESGHGEKLKTLSKNGVHETHILQGTDEDRVLEYRGLIRECFARNKSLFICVPTIEDGNRLMHELTRGIENYVYFISSELTGKQLLSAWKKALLEKHPILIIGTGGALTIPRADLDMIIIEREGSRFYKSQNRPFADARFFARQLARHYNIKLIIGDCAVRIETLYKEEAEDSGRSPSSKMRVGGSGSTLLVDMKKDARGEKRAFEVLGSEVRNSMQEALANNERIFLFTNRTGLSGTTLCNNCGTTVLCNSCSTPVVLHSGKASNHFLCHRCGERRDALEACKSCGGWDLKDFGIGIEKVRDVIKREFPNTAFFELTRDIAKTRKGAEVIADKFLNTPSSIMIGTEFALPYLSRKIERSVVVSLDSLFAMPDFKINERIFNILLLMRSLSRQQLMVQSRMADYPLFSAALRGDFLSFYRDELEKRRIFNWPPFTSIIKISIEGSKNDVALKMKQIVDSIPSYNPEVFPAFVPTKSKQFMLHALIRLEPRAWIDQRLLTFLKSLPLDYRIEVDPETIL